MPETNIPAYSPILAALWLASFRAPINGSPCYVVSHDSAPRGEVYAVTNDSDRLGYSRSVAKVWRETSEPFRDATEEERAAIGDYNRMATDDGLYLAYAVSRGLLKSETVENFRNADYATLQRGDARETWKLVNGTWHMQGGADYSPLAARHMPGYAECFEHYMAILTKRVAPNLDQYRDNSGKLVDIGLGCYAQAYVCTNGDTLCADCTQKAIDAANSQGYLIGDEPAEDGAFSTADTDARVVCANCDRVLSEGTPEFDGIEYDINGAYLSAIINDDYSSLDAEESEMLRAWLAKESTENGRGHWSIDPEDEGRFTTCDVCGLLATCYTVQYVEMTA